MRSRPFADGLHDAAFSLYDQTRPVELEARNSGASAHEAATLGLGRLAGLLADAGFATYEEFIWVALPAEVEARLAQSAGIAQRPYAMGPLAGMLAAAQAIEAELRTWASRLVDLQGVADRLLVAAPQLDETARLNRDIAENIRARDSDQQFATAMVYLRLWAEMAPEVSAIVSDLVDDLADLRRSCAQTRFRIALAVLHNIAVGQFVVELIDAVPGSAESRPAIAGLCRALEEGLAETDEQSARNVELAAAAADRITQLVDLLDLPQVMIREWLARADLSSPGFAAVAEQVHGQVGRTQADIDLLAALAGECRRIAVPLDVSLVNEQLDLLDQGVTRGSRFA